MKLMQKSRGFTLIELLVVVAIIALLAVGVFPLYSKIMLEMKAKSAMKQAYQIHQSLFAYAQGNDQNFPNEGADGGNIATSNEAYRALFVKGLTDDERLFYVQGCAYHNNKKVDGDIGKPEDGFTKAVEAGENHWGYVTNLSSDRSDSTLPIVMDGGNSPGVWSRDVNAKGGVWKGLYAVVVRIGGNAKVYDLNQQDLTVKDRKDGKDVDMFSSDFGTNKDDIKDPE